MDNLSEKMDTIEMKVRQLALRLDRAQKERDKYLEIKLDYDDYKTLIKDKLSLQVALRRSYTELFQSPSFAKIANKVFFLGEQGPGVCFTHPRRHRQ